MWFQVALYPLTLALLTRLSTVNPRQLAQLDVSAPSVEGGDDQVDALGRTATWPSGRTSSRVGRRYP